METNISEKFNESLKQIIKESHQMLELIEEVNKLQNIIKNQNDLIIRYRRMYQAIENKLRSAGDENINDEIRSMIRYEIYEVVNIDSFNPDNLQIIYSKITKAE